MSLAQTILLSASTNKLSVTHEEAEDYAALIMDLLDNKNRGYIEVPILTSTLNMSCDMSQRFSISYLSTRFIICRYLKWGLSSKQAYQILLLLQLNKAVSFVKNKSQCQGEKCGSERIGDGPGLFWFGWLLVVRYLHGNLFNTDIDRRLKWWVIVFQRPREQLRPWNSIWHWFSSQFAETQSRGSARTLVSVLLFHLTTTLTSTRLVLIFIF